MKAKHFRLVTTARLFLTAALLAASVGALAPPPVAHAATFTVNTTADTDDAAKGDGICADSSGNCSLRAAISEANALAGADTITLPAGTYTLTRTGAGENNNATGDLDLKSAITLNGAGANNTVIDANQIDRVLQVFGGATVELNGVKLTNGRTPNLDADGGGVLNSGNLTIRNCIISNNTTGHYGSGGRGGGVSSSGTLTIENSTIRDNVTGDADTSGFPGGYGGGVYIEDGTATIRDSTISGNTTGNGFTSGDDGYGGGVYVRTGTVTIENSTISGNAAKGYSGGVHYRLATAVVTLTHCTITGNTADADADSAFGHGGGIGGGVGSMNVKNTIVSGNTDRGQSDTNDS
jgi:CSLREA domain-containing protein